MIIPSWLIEVWLWSFVVIAFVLIGLAFLALGECLNRLRRRHYGGALNAAGLFVAFIATSLAIISVPDRMASDAQAAHRYNCIMYELALQRNANPDLTDVPIDPTWDGLECYPTP